MTISTDVFKSVRFKKQSALGTKATASAAQVLRRVASSLEFKRANFQSAEIKPSQQVSDMRLGLKSVDGSIDGELSSGTYSEFFASVVRGDYSSAATTGALTDVTAAATGPQYVTAAGDFFVAGFRVGMILRWTGWVATGNNDNNFLITALTATNMTGVHLNGDAVTAEAAGASVTGLQVGKHVFTPTSGHLRDYYTVEHWFSDISQGESFTDCVPSGINLGVTPDGMATISIPMLGLGMDPDTSEYFTSPTAATSTGILAGPNGVLIIDGVSQSTVTSLSDLTINGQNTPVGGVVGSTSDPDILPGVLIANGTMTILFEDATVRDKFLNETESSVTLVMTASISGTADFIAITMPRIKFTDASKSVNNNANLQTMTFTALENQSGGVATGTYPGTVTIQDSQAV